MSTVIQVCNMALARINVMPGINSIDEQSKEAIACKLFYETMRDFVLKDYDWGFARCRVALALLDVEAPTNWDYTYAYPSDCLEIRSVVIPGMPQPRSDQRIPYKLGNVADVRVIHTNAQDTEIEYTRRVTDPTLFDVMFVTALAWMLASEIAMPLTGKVQLAADAITGYQRTVARAAAANLNEAEEGPEPLPAAIAARE
jgi:hypothetical protein